MDSSALVSSSIPLLFATGGLGLLIGSWAIRLPHLALWLLGVTVVSGQLLRFPLPGQGGGLLPSDVAVVLVLLAVAYRSPHRPGASISVARTGALLFTPFIVWSIGVLALSSALVTLSQAGVAIAYWVRLTVHLLLVPALVCLARERQLRQTMYTVLVGVVSALVVLGYVQLLVVPHLAAIGGGWDPHEGRLVSTWLDPNFFGVFLVSALPVVGGYALKRHSVYARWLVVALLMGGGIAVILTQSRSSLLALLGAAVLVSPLVIIRQAALPTFRTKAARVRLVVGGVLLLGAVGGLIGGFHERILGSLTFDATVELRIQSLRTAWELVADNPLHGVGYNAYQFAAAQAGHNTDFSIHSRAGTDNSLLTLWVTTGLVGVALFLLPWGYVFQRLIQRWRYHGTAESIAACYAVVALALHSQTVNSWLYGHLLIMVAMSIALGLTVSSNTVSSGR